jgi:hypothetical protein
MTNAINIHQQACQPLFLEEWIFHACISVAEAAQEHISSNLGSATAQLCSALGDIYQLARIMVWHNIIIDRSIDRLAG